jgi:hypothetical protein
MSAHLGKMPKEWPLRYRQPKIIEIDGVAYVTAEGHRATMDEIAQDNHETAQLFAEAIVMLYAARAEIRELKGDV